MVVRRTIYMSLRIMCFTASPQADETSCFAEPASTRRIHPPAFGRPPFSKGGRFIRIESTVLNRLLLAALSPLES